MNIFTKNRILVGVLILSIAINIAILGTLGYNKAMRRIADRNEIRNKNEMQNRPKQMRFIAKELNLNEEQEQQFKDLRQKHFQHSQENRMALGNHYHQIMKELSAPEPNQILLDSLAKQIGRLHVEQQKATIDHFLSLRKICTFEQYQKLQHLFTRMMEREQMNQREGLQRMKRPDREQKQRENTAE